MQDNPSAAPLTNADAERALAALERWAADRDRPLIVLAGAAKAGKTVLLDVLAARLGRSFSVVYLSRSGADPDELSARILASLGNATDGTPRLVLAREIERRADRPLVLLLDDADTLSPRVELWLFDLARRSDGALRVVLALSDARLARELAAAFRAGTEIVSIGTSMTKAEADSYLRSVAARASESRAGSHPRLAEGGAPAFPPRAAPAPSRHEPGPDDSARPARSLSPRATPTPPRVAAPPTPPAAESPVNAVRRGSRLRWIALAAALVLSFVAGFFLSELRAVRSPAFVETADIGRSAALPSVSAAPATSPPTPLPTEPAGADLPTPELAAQRAPILAEPQPFSPRPSPEAALPVDRRVDGQAVEAAPAADPGATTDSGSAGAEGPGVPELSIATASLPGRATAIGRDPAPASAELRDAEPGESADADGGNSLAERPTVPTAQPARPRLVKVQVQAEPGAEVRIGDRALGAAPVGAVELPPGAHRLLVRLPDGREVARIVEVRGTRYEIQVR